jgi:hypothetical protein
LGVVKMPINDFVIVSIPKSNENLSLEIGDIKLSWNSLPPTDWISDLIKALK